jgi:RNA polymerase sigma-70 factor (ECF subfamily)
MIMPAELDLRRVDDVALIRDAAAGDPDAVRALKDTVLPTVYGFILGRLGGDEHVAADILQETLIEARRAAQSFRGDSSLTTWLCGIARHRIWKHFRRERKQQEVARRLMPVPGPGDPRPNTVRVVADVDPVVVIDVRDEVLGAMRALPSDYREVLALKYMDDMSVHEIARQTQRTQVQIQSLLQRARRRFKAALEDARG